MKKRFLAALLVFVIAFSSFSGFSLVEAENTLTEEKMTEVLIAVKGKLDIGDEYTEFDYSYSEYTGNGVYQFYWRTEDGNAYISVSADSTGRILRLYSNDYTKNSEREGMMPTYIGEELIPKAEAWIEKVEPDVKGKLNLKKCSYSIYNKSYTFSFVRNENGIDMNDNYISLTMDAFDASVTSYGINWDFEVSIPNAKSIISKEEAAKEAGKKVNMVLRYRLTYDSEGKEKIFLAYSPDRTYVAVDAKNGKIYTEKVYWGSGTDFDEGFNDEAAEAEEAAYESNDSKEVRLSDAEIKKIDEIKDIITSEEAVSLIKNNNMLFIDPNLTSARCNLYSRDGEYFWSIYLTDDRPIDYSDNSSYYDYYRASASAYINAKTGKLISFSATTKDYYDYTNEGSDTFKANYTKKQCKKAFEDFIKATDPEKYEYVKLSNTYDQQVTIYNYNSYDKYTYLTSGYSYSYGRYYKDIPFDSNSISGAVEAVTGKVTRYYVNWSDAEIPEPENLIGEEKAFDAYISCDGFDLVYELVEKYDDYKKYYGYDREVKARLVYRTSIYPNYIDAFTGTQLNYYGEEYKPAGVSYKYTDINGTKYERAIKLLADMGYGFDGEEYMPDAKITNEEFERLLGAGGYYYGYSYYDENDDDDANDVVNDDNSTVTRQEAARLVIIRLGGEKMAQMDIYKTGYSDEKKIAKENIGAVALCKGLGIMTAKSGKKFKPNNAVTRGEAADIIIKMLSSSL